MSWYGYREKGCGWCGALFQPNRYGHRFCSGRCRVAAHRVTLGDYCARATGALLHFGAIHQLQMFARWVPLERSVTDPQLLEVTQAIAGARVTDPDPVGVTRRILPQAEK